MVVGAARAVPAGRAAEKAVAPPAALAPAEAARRSRARVATGKAEVGVGLAVSSGVDAIQRVPTMHIEGDSSKVVRITITAGRRYVACLPGREEGTCDTRAG